jgi:transcriptional regulator with PAS, ATPase and Fis domain
MPPASKKSARRQPTNQAPPSGIVGDSQAIQYVLRLIAKMAPAEDSVLIQGESGTGKELVAQELHRTSRRVDKPFVAVNCAAISESLMESELFGHEKGAYTSADTSKPGLIEVADQGTLFIDEIGEMTGPLQAKLLRVLENKCVRRVGATNWLPVNIRLVTATNKDLIQEVAAGRFRIDLYYRLAVLLIRLPPLRERREDIPLLVRHFLALDPMGPQEVDAAALSALMQHNWPGNIRELQNAMRRAIVFAEGALIRLQDLPETVLQTHASPLAPATVSPVAAPPTNLDELEKQHIWWVLESEAWNMSHTAQKLGISRPRLYRLVRKHHLEKKQS